MHARGNTRSLPCYFRHCGIWLQVLRKDINVMPTLNRFHRRRMPDCGTQTLDRRSPERLQFEGDGAMRNFSPGIWTCAALYAAIGLIGIFLLASGPGVATSSEGYGIAAVAAPASLR